MSPTDQQNIWIEFQHAVMWYLKLASAMLSFRRHFSCLIILQNQFHRQHSALKKKQKKLSLCDLGPQMRVTATKIMLSFGLYTIGDTMMMTVCINSDNLKVNYPHPYFRSARTGCCYAFIYRNLKIHYFLNFDSW